jgi:predicted patatin/cPLA2 family phospholipase
VKKATAVACMSGAFKGAFVHGVLTALEALNISFSAYAATSISTLPAAYAAVNKISRLTMDFWYENLEWLEKPGITMSDVVLTSIGKYAPLLDKLQLLNSTKRFLVACSYVNNAEATQITQGDNAVRLGRKLIMQAARKDTRWKNQNLDCHVFDTQSQQSEFLITPGNLKDVMYATTRMLHAWHIPASIGGKPYIDGSYTCMCPVEPLIERGYKEILVIAAEPGQIYTDIFSSKKITPEMHGCSIHVIQPGMDLKTLGVDYIKATPEGLKKTFDHGMEKGKEYIEKKFY